MKLKRSKSLFLAIIVILIISLYFFSKHIKTCSKLNCLTIEGFDKFKTRKVYQDDKNIYRALLSHDKDLLRVNVRSNIPQDQAKKQIKMEVFRMKALFSNATSPYPGEISDEIECGQNYIPIFKEERINGIDVSYFKGFLNDRLTFGVCTEKQAKYQGFLTLLYCPNNKQLFQLEIITHKDNFNTSPDAYEKMLKSITCKS